MDATGVTEHAELVDVLARRRARLWAEQRVRLTYRSSPAEWQASNEEAVLIASRFALDLAPDYNSQDPDDREFYLT